MKISTCVIRKLNKTFIWAASRPPILFVVVLWLFEFCWNQKMVVNYTKWCPAKSLHGAMVHILRTLIALEEGFPLLRPNISANLSSTPTKELNEDPFVEFLSTHEYGRRLVQMSGWSHFLIFFCKTEIRLFECLEKGREREINLCHLGSKQCVLRFFLLPW